MNIAISGCHSQGKTTLCKDLMHEPIFRKFSLLGNITRGIRDRGVVINEYGTDWSQGLVIAKHIEHFFMKGNNLLDRCMLDGVVYTDTLFLHEKRVSDIVRNYAVHVFKELVLKTKYDVIFYIEPTLGLDIDNVRSTDIQFFNNVKALFEAYITGYNIDVVRITGSREERVKMVLDTLKQKFNIE